MPGAKACKSKTDYQYMCRCQLCGRQYISKSTADKKSGVLAKKMLYLHYEKTHKLTKEEINYIGNPEMRRCSNITVADTGRIRSYEHCERAETGCPKYN